MNKILKSSIALALAALITCSAASCSKSTKTKLDLEKFPLVYADENGLEAINEGEEEPTLITKQFYTFLNADNKVQAASNGKVYYVETKDSKTTIGDLYAYDVEKKESELVHEGVYSYKVSHDGECIIFSDGSGAIYRYNKRYENKEEYPAIQSKGVSHVLDISADGKYVLYAQVLTGTKYSTLTMAKTDFETTEEIDAMALEDLKANDNISKAPVIVAENYKEYLGGADDLSLVYYSQSLPQKDSKEQLPILSAFKNYKENVVLRKGEFEQYFVSDSGEILFSKTAKNAKKIEDILVDKEAESDAKLKKADASAKEWKAKVARDNVREKVNTYLKNIATTDFYTFNASMDKAELVQEICGQLSGKGIDEESGMVFFGGTVYDFEGAETTDINKVSVVYKLFDQIKSRAFCAVNLKGAKYLNAGEKAEYNSGDCYVDTAAKTIHIIMNFDYLKSKVGQLYNVPYTEEDFGEAKLVAEKAAKVAHFDSGEDNYYVLANNALVLNDEKTVVLKDYSGASNNGKVKLAFTSIGTGKKDDFGNEIMEDTAYVISGDKASKIASVFNQRQIVDKGSIFAYYTTYDYKKGAGEMMLYNGEKTFSLGKKVSHIYKFG